MPKIRRKTDSILDWLGDWGGLYDGLNLIADFLVTNYSTFILNSKLAFLIVKFLPSKLSLK